MASSSNEHDHAQNVAIRDETSREKSRPSDTSPPEAEVFRVTPAFVVHVDPQPVHARERETLPELAECAACDGYGEVLTGRGSSQEDAESDSEDCKACGGSGFADPHVDGLAGTDPTDF